MTTAHCRCARRSAAGRQRFSTLGNGRVLFDYFFPGAVPGGAFTVPQGTSFAPVLPHSIGIQRSRRRTLRARAADVAIRQRGEAALHVSAGTDQLGDECRRLQRAFYERRPRSNERPHPLRKQRHHLPRLGKRRGAQCRGRALRRAAGRGELFEKFYTPPGTSRSRYSRCTRCFDPVAPFAQEPDYAKVVQGAGASAWLAQRSVTSYGHCNINTNEAVAAFSTLVAWANGGPSPAPLGDGTIRP